MIKDIKSLVRPFFDSNRRSNALTGRGVSADDWGSASRGVNYLLGRGNQLIPVFHQDIPSGSSMPDVGGFTLYSQVMRVAPSYSALDRYWSFSFSSDGAGIVEIIVSGSQLNQTELYPININQTVNLYREPVNSVSTDVSGTQEVRVLFRVSSSNGSGIIPTRWSCFEAPRKTLNPLSSSTEGGVNEGSFRVGYPIYDSGIDQYESPVGVARNIQIARKQVRRAGLFCWSVPLDQSGNEFDTFALICTSSVYEEKLKFPIITKPTYRDVTSSNVLLMWVGRSADFRAGGTVKFENGLGDQIEYNLTGVSGLALEAWQSGSLPVPCFDVNHDRGFPTGSVGAPGFIPYITMSMKVTNQITAQAADQPFKIWTVQAFEPHEDLLEFSGSYTS